MEIGHILGQYRIEGHLGEGGMGSVYRAEDTRLKRQVAIKVLPVELARDAERLARMEREAQVLAALDHPNIAAIYGLEEADDTRFLVMQLAEGQTLADRLDSGPIPLEEALGIALRIAEALEAAHEKGIVHRDLKPANVQVSDQGKVMLLDFGLAKVYETTATTEDAKTSLEASPTFVQATQAGMILGTAPYMSPEQARGQLADARSDTWAFGCVLYEMLSGERTFVGPTVTDVLGSIVHKDVDWARLPKRTPRRIRMLMHRCLRKDPTKRLQAIGDARLALWEYLEDPRSVEDVLGAPRPPAPTWQRALPWALAVAALGWAGLAAFGGSSATPTADPLRVRMELGSDDLFAAVGTSLLLTPDGRSLVYVTNSAAGESLLIRHMDQLNGQVLASGGAYNPFLSPDANWIGFSTRDSLHKVPVTGGTPIPIVSVDRSRGASWGADGTIVFARSPVGGLSVVSEAGGEPRALTELDAEAGEQTHRWPQVLPDGRVLFTAHTSTTDFDGAAIEVVDPATGERTALLRGGYYGNYVEATGHLLYVNDSTVFAVELDLDSLALVGSPVPIIQDIAGSSANGAAQLGFSANGRIVYATGGLDEPAYPAVWVDSAGRASPLWNEARTFGEPRVAPDGRRVSFMALDDNNWDVWVYDVEREVATRLTFDEGLDAPGIWSPDGQYVAFSSGRGGAFNLYRKRADGSGDVERITEASVDQFISDWSADGRHVVFHQGDDIWVLDLEAGGEPEPFLETPFYEGEAAFSPDGRWLAYGSDETGRFEVYVRPFPAAGGKWQVSSNGGHYPRWSADGSRLFYRGDNGVLVASVETDGSSFRPGRPQQLFTGDYRGGTGGLVAGGLTLADYAVTPDGERFVMFPATVEDSIGVTLVTLETGWFERLRQATAVANR